MNSGTKREGLIGNCVTTKVFYRFRLLKDKKNSSDEKLLELSKNVERRFAHLREIEQTLPKSSNGLYLKIILGNVNVSILNKNDKYAHCPYRSVHAVSDSSRPTFNSPPLFTLFFSRFRYKDEYEKFKLVLSVIALMLCVLNLIVIWR